MSLGGHALGAWYRGRRDERWGVQEGTKETLEAGTSQAQAAHSHTCCAGDTDSTSVRGPGSVDWGPLGALEGEQALGRNFFTSGPKNLESLLTDWGVHQCQRRQYKTEK